MYTFAPGGRAFAMGKPDLQRNGKLREPQHIFARHKRNACPGVPATWGPLRPHPQPLSLSLYPALCSPLHPRSTLSHGHAHTELRDCHDLLNLSSRGLEQGHCAECNALQRRARTICPSHSHSSGDRNSQK